MLPDDLPDPLALLRADRDRARDLGDPSADVACFATVDADGQPHARFVTLRTVDEAGVTFWADEASPKLAQLRGNPRCALTVWWPSLARQYRLTGRYAWYPAAELPELYAARPWRAKVWDWLHQELPQGAPAPDREALIARHEQQGDALRATWGDEARVPPPEGAGQLHLDPLRVEVQHIDAARRLHDRRLFVRAAAGWSSTALVP